MSEVNVENQKNNCVEEECVKIPKKMLDIVAGNWDINEVLAFIVEMHYQDQYPKSNGILKWGEEEFARAIERLDEIMKKYYEENKNMIYKNDERYMMIEQYTNNEDLQEALEEFIYMRQFINCPITVYAFELILKRLSELSTDDEEKIKILEQSIICNWKNIFPINSKEEL